MLIDCCGYIYKQLNMETLLCTFVNPNPFRSTLADDNVDGVTLVCNLRIPLLFTISSQGNSVAYPKKKNN